MNGKPILGVGMLGASPLWVLVCSSHSLSRTLATQVPCLLGHPFCYKTGTLMSLQAFSSARVFMEGLLRGDYGYVSFV